MTLLAGSNTVKGTINDGMDAEFALKLGKTVGRIYGSAVAVAMDGRTSNVMLKDALTAGIMSVGCDVIDLGEVPTPLIQYYMADHPEIHGGVTITASFAGQDINGFRIMKSEGVEDPIFVENSVKAIMSVGSQATGQHIGEIFKAPDFIDGYVDSILTQVDAEAIRNAGLKICLDCRNNAVAIIASTILMRLSVDVITIGGDSSVLDEDRLVKLGHVVKSHGLDLGIAIEMDADHCLFATETGEGVSGDKSFSLIAKSILAEKKGKVVVPINSTSLMEDVIIDSGGSVVHCTVGEQTVVRTVKENDAVLGGDLFGCLVFPGHMYTCDALMGMVKMVELVVKNGPLSEQIESFPNYYISRDSFECPVERIPEIMDRFIAMHTGDDINKMDGVKVFVDDGWILVRQSNVPGVIKVYAQSDSRETSQRWVDSTIAELSKDFTA